MCNTDADYSRICPPSICFKDEVRNYLISIANLENTDNCFLKFDMLKNGKLIKKTCHCNKVTCQSVKRELRVFLEMFENTNSLK